jgi:hypothetical protein
MPPVDFTASLQSAGLRPGRVPTPAATPAQPQGGRLATFPRSDTEEIRLEIATYEGRRFINARKWFRTAEGKWLPTKAGVSIRTRELSEWIEALTGAESLLCGGGQ